MTIPLEPGQGHVTTLLSQILACIVHTYAYEAKNVSRKKKTEMGKKIVQRSLSTSAKLACCPPEKKACLLVSQILCPRSIFNPFKTYPYLKSSMKYTEIIMFFKNKRMKSELFFSVMDTLMMLDGWS